jgi:hypothetical protein
LGSTRYGTPKQSQENTRTSILLTGKALTTREREREREFSSSVGMDHLCCGFHTPCCRRNTGNGMCNLYSELIVMNNKLWLNIEARKKSISVMLTATEP